MERNHFSHRHKLKPISSKKPYFCSGCKEPGFERRHRCELCDYDLHKDCMDPHRDETVRHKFFTNSTFRFLSEPPENWPRQKRQRYCYACGKPVKGFFYHDEDGRDLHPSCHKLPSELSVDGVDFTLCDKVLSTCLWCNKKKRARTVSGIRGWSYVSKTKDKERHFHVSCLTELALEAWGKEADNDNELGSALKNVKLPGQRLIGFRISGKKVVKIAKFGLKQIGALL
ncbi:uncharacterized protein LOC123227829 [Mangifera indica]|uniref:uncharacterized protein LOC123227829 n=1 Tax=Mangifera indica TaxID=29780 RepID=UPI001CFC24AC|nr:uncharacterized protein LOC123227829 [Mangifera indica]